MQNHQSVHYDLELLLTDLCAVYRFFRGMGVDPLMQCVEDPKGVCKEGVDRCVIGRRLQRTIVEYRKFLSKC